MNRRSFVGMLAAIGASIALPVRLVLPARQVKIAPRLWGDGVHDDTAALQWYIDHAIPIPMHGDYYITRTLRVTPTGRMDMQWSRLTGKRGVEPLILIEPRAHGLSYGNVFETHGLRVRGGVENPR